MRLTSKQRDRMMEMFRAFPTQLFNTLVPYTRASIFTVEGFRGEWTVAQIVHHIADAHIHAYIQFKHILTEDNPTLISYQPDKWARTTDASSIRVYDSVLLVDGLHNRWATLMAVLTPEQWQRKGTYANFETMSLEGLLEDIVHHGQNHLGYIEKTLEAATRQETYAFLKRAFPNVPSSNELFVLMYVFRHTGDMTFRAIAHTVAILMGSQNPNRDYIQYLHDTYETDMRHPDESEILEMRERLNSAGFAEWIEE